MDTNIFCTLPWWLMWIIPALLGFLLGWSLWAKYKKMVADLENKVGNMEKQISDMEARLTEKKNRIADLVGDVATAEGRMKEAITQLELVKKEAAANASKGGGGQAASGGNAAEVSALKSQLADAQEEVDKWKAKAAQAAASATAASFAANSLAASTGGASQSGGASSIFSKVAEDNLQIIEGIGPKMNEILNAAGIRTFSQLASKTDAQVRAILESGGGQSALANPESWIAEAKLAAVGKWDEVIASQKADGSESKLEKYLISKGYM